ncbi:MAG: THUMP domain-containing protein [Candidatus Methanomethylicia archaeon]
MKIFVLLSGEHIELSEAELYSILKAENIKFSVLDRLPQVIGLKLNKKDIGKIIARSSMCKLIGKLLLLCDADKNVIINSLSRININLKSKTFNVRIDRIRGCCKHISGYELEVLIGNIIRERSSGSVNLSSPDIRFYGVLTGEKFIFGTVISQIKRSKFNERKPRKRPFFHPGTIEPLFARLLVNLSEVPSGEILFDPFCGAGGILIEAGLINCRVIGSDIDPAMVMGAAINLKYYNIDYDLVVADARFLPFRNIKYISTDPPYGVSSTTMGENVKNLVETFLKNIYQCLNREAKICISVPQRLDINFRTRYRLINEYFMRVHKSLTRRIVLLVKDNI